MSSQVDNNAQAVRSALDEFTQSKASFGAVVDYCRAAYAQAQDPPKVYAETMRYTQDVLGHVAYNVHHTATRLNESLAAQEAELSRADVTLRAVSDRLRGLHAAAGASGLRTPQAALVYTREKTFSKLDDRSLPPTSQPLQQWSRIVVDYQNLPSYVGVFPSSPSSTRPMSGTQSQASRAL